MDPNTLGPELGPHYYGIKYPSIIDNVVQLIDKYHDQAQIRSHVSLAFVKNFTKVASNVIDYYEKQEQPHPFSLNQLIWIYDFNNVGINKIISNQYSNKNTELSIQRMHSHFYSHMGGVAEIIAKASQSQNDKIWWLDRAYEDSFYSIIHGEETDTHPAYQSFHKSKIAKNIAEAVQDEQEIDKWFNISLEDAEEALEELREIDPDHCVYITLHIADTYSYQTSFYNGEGSEDIEKKIQALKNAYSAYKTALPDLERVNTTDLFTTKTRLGEVAFMIYDLIENPEKTLWLKTASENIEDVLKNTESVKQDKLHRVYYCRARIDLENYSASENIILLEKAYENIEKAIDLTNGTNEEVYLKYMNTKTNILKKILEVEKDKTKKIAFLVDAVYTFDELIKSKQNEEKKGMCYTIKASYEAELAESALEERLKSPIFEQIIGKISHKSDGFIEELKQNSNLRKYFLRMALFDNLTGAELIRRHDEDSKFEQHYYITKFNAAMCAFDLFMLAHDQKDINTALEAYNEYTSYFNPWQSAQWNTPRLNINPLRPSPA